MLKLLPRRPITHLVALFLALLGPLAEPQHAIAFPLNDGAAANDLTGQADFATGFVPFDEDPFFGAQPASERRFFVTSDVAYDLANERLFVADIHNHRFLIFDLTGGVTDDMAATFVLGQPDFFTGGADPNDPFGHFNTPNTTFGCTAPINACGVHRAWSVAYDGNRNLLFGADPDNNRVLVWDLGAVIQNGMPATYVLGQQSFTTNAADAACADGTVGRCGMNFPQDIAVGGDRLFVADADNNRVLVFDLSGGVDTGMAATAVLGQATFTTRAANAGCGGAGGGSPNACGLDGPGSLAFDAATGRLFVSEVGSSRIVVYQVGGGIVSGMPAAHVLGQPDFSTATPNTGCGGGSGGEQNANACGLGMLGTSLAHDINSDFLYVSDAANHRVLVFDVGGISNGEPAIGVLGQASFSAGYDPSEAALGGETSRDGLVSPYGLTFDPLHDRLFVADGGNHRVLVFSGNVDGAPVDVEGGSSTATENEDGTTTVDIMSDDGDPFSVDFPPGTEPLPGEDEVTVEVESLSFGFASGIRIDAELPPGTTKSVTLARPLLRRVCIFDHAMAEFSNSIFCNGGDRVSTPGNGQCRDVEVSGDPGDNPDDENDPNGTHEITVCTAADGETVTVSGLLHTLIAFGPTIAGDRDALLDSALSDPAEPEIEPSAAGCRTVLSNRASSASTIGVLLAFALVIMALRRRAWR